MNYIIATHVFYNKEGKDTYGPAHSVYDYLVKTNKKVFLVKHSLNGSFGSCVVDKKGTTELKKYQNNNLLFDAFTQISLNIAFANCQRVSKNIYIGVDPINSLAGLWLKLNRKTVKNIFLTADYADRRFKNIFLNLMYHMIDRISLAFADEVWCVSSRIVNKRLGQVIDKEKVKLLPNSPDTNMVLTNQRKKKDLIIVANMTKAIDLVPLFKSVKTLSADYPDIKLRVVGAGPEKQHFENIAMKMKLEKSVLFLGLRPHDEAMELISKSFLGFALYANENPWNTYGDSMKAREYVACGVPVIINDIPSTADDVEKYKAGLVLSKIDDKQITKFIKKCFDDHKYYQDICRNAFRMGEDFCKERILQKLL